MSNNQISIIFMTLGVLCILAMAYGVFPVEDNVLTFVGITFFLSLIHISEPTRPY